VPFGGFGGTARHNVKEIARPLYTGKNQEEKPPIGSANDGRSFAILPNVQIFSID
jgi:hypothetical protein